MNTAFKALIVLQLVTFPARALAIIDWKEFTYNTNDHQAITAQLGQLQLPEDAARADGAKVTLAMLRLPSTERGAGEPMVFLHGGPGGAAITALEVPAFRQLFEAARREGDVILFDQRGCGKSTPSLIPQTK